MSNHLILDEEALQYAHSRYTTSKGGRFATISKWSFGHPDTMATIDIPACLTSDESLMFCGFTPEAATNLHAQYRRSREPGNSLIHFAEKEISLAETQLVTEGPKLSLREVLAEFGLCEELREAILNPEFEDIRRTETLSYWTNDALNIRWEFLCDLSRSIKATHVKRNAKAITDAEPESPVDVNKIQKEDIKDSPDEIELDPKAKENLCERLRVSGHGKSLFRGGLRSRLDQAFVFGRPKILNIHHLFCRAPTDFHPTSRSTIYFADQLETAQRYARYAVNNSRGTGIGSILEMLPPDGMLSNCSPVNGEHWRDLVWYCRRDDQWRTPQPAVASLLNKDLLAGPICNQNHYVVNHLLNHKSELRRMVLSDSNFATQTSFMNPNAIEQRCPEIFWIMWTLGGTGEENIIVGSHFVVG